MSLEDLFNQMFEEFNNFINNDMQKPAGFSCDKCAGPVAPLTGGVCEECKFDELNLELASIIQEAYGNEEAIMDDIAMYAMGIPADYNPFYCLN